MDKKNGMKKKERYAGNVWVQLKKKRRGRK